MIKKLLIALIAFMCLYAFSDKPAEAISFPDPTLIINGAPIVMQYGDAYSYSLPYLDALIDLGDLPGYASGTFTIHSSPGWIKDGIVLYTGSGGVPVTTNFPGMDDAMPAVSGNGAGDTTFDSSIDYLGETWPDGTWDQQGSWDTSLSDFVIALTTIADPNPTNAMFFFNNNQSNSGGSDDQSLYAYGLITFTGPSVDEVGFELIDVQTAGGDPTLHTWDGGEPDPWNSRSDPGEFIHVMGENTFPIIGALNHNLGANLAAYAIYFPEINFQWLLSEGYDAMHGDFRMRDLNNGHEQLFILLDDGSGQVPEPGTLVLLGSGLIGLAIYSRRKLKG